VCGCVCGVCVKKKEFVDDLSYVAGSAVYIKKQGGQLVSLKELDSTVLSCVFAIEHLT
jgi:hypothetical protein